MAAATLLLLTGGGALIGLLLAVLGAGGSILLLPLLVTGAGLPIQAAVPLSLLVVSLLALGNIGPLLAPPPGGATGGPAAWPAGFGG
jgi:uncharacterized membrane protein YfcA